MVKRCLILIVLLLALLLGTVSAEGTPQLPYAIRVNCAANTVTIYTQDAQGDYTVPYKAMICSTARDGYLSPLGTYRLKDFRSEWRLMVDGTYGQYATCITGNYLFHSICYSDDAHDSMVRESYNNLGTSASMGCVRLETADAKWIFDNCPAGTPVTLYEDAENPGPLGKPARTIDYITEAAHNGWDPSDPVEGNPWHREEVTALTLEPARLTLTAGETAGLTAVAEPKKAVLIWSSSDETVVKVDSLGRITALGAGTAKVTARGYRGVQATCVVTVEQELLPFDDLIPGAWYYPEIRQALESGLFSGLAPRIFAPDGSMTRAMVVQVLYNLEGKPAAPKATPFADVSEDAWYHDAVAWAAENGIVQGILRSAKLYSASCPSTSLSSFTLAFPSRITALCTTPFPSGVDTIAPTEGAIFEYSS